jgi:hypothetical protein
MVDRGGDHRLAPEALAVALLLGVLWADQLERDVALKRELLGLVDDAHVPVTDDLLDAAAGDDGARGKRVRGRSGGFARGDRRTGGRRSGGRSRR